MISPSDASKPLKSDLETSPKPRFSDGIAYLGRISPKVGVSPSKSEVFGDVASSDSRYPKSTPKPPKTRILPVSGEIGVFRGFRGFGGGIRLLSGKSYLSRLCHLKIEVSERFSRSDF